MASCCQLPGPCGALRPANHQDGSSRGDVHRGPQSNATRSHRPQPPAGAYASCPLQLPSAPFRVRAQHSDPTPIADPFHIHATDGTRLATISLPQWAFGMGALGMASGRHSVGDTSQAVARLWVTSVSHAEVWLPLCTPARSHSTSPTHRQAPLLPSIPPSLCASPLPFRLCSRTPLPQSPLKLLTP